MIDRCCLWCGYHFDAGISYRGRRLLHPPFGRWRAWCSVKHREKSYRVHRQQLKQQARLRQHFQALEQRGQLRWDFQ